MLSCVKNVETILIKPHEFWGRKLNTRPSELLSYVEVGV
jgi:hypothetical protein